MIHKKITLLLLFSVVFYTVVFAQKKKKQEQNTTDTTQISTNVPVVQTPISAPKSPAVSNPAPLERSSILGRMYALGFRYYDLQVSQMALYEMIAADLNNIALRDSLALLYYNMGKYGSAIAVCTDVLSVEKNNLAMLEVRALCNENLKLFNDALLDYEKLNIHNPSPFIVYKIATLQYNQKRYEEAKNNIEMLLKDSSTDSLKVNVNINVLEQQEIPIKAAALNIKGMLYRDLGNKEIAQKSFAEALKLAPQFKLAKENALALIKPAVKK